MEPFLLLSLLILSSLLLSIWKRTKDPVAYSPSFKSYPLAGHILSNWHRAADWLSEVLTAAPTNTVVMVMPGDDHGVMTANISNVEHILRTDFQNYPKGERFSTILHDFLGTGIFNADGETWWAQRKTASFEFNSRSLRSFAVQCVKQEIQTQLLPLLERVSANGQAVDLQNVFDDDRRGEPNI